MNVTFSKRHIDAIINKEDMRMDLDHFAEVFGVDRPNFDSKDSIAMFLNKCAGNEEWQQHTVYTIARILFLTEN